MEELPASFDERLLKVLFPFFHLAFKYHRYEVKGLEHIPRIGPAILVTNHSFATYDGFLLGASIYLHTGRSPCGLADNNLFRTSWLKKFSHSFRLVEANHRNAERLLKNKELLCLAPGGMREALRPTGTESFKVRWKKRTGFAKLSIKTQCPIILAACPAADKIYDIYPNYLTKFIYKNFKLPFVFLRGLGPTLIPRPVKLTHYISPPLVPPVVRHPDEYEHKLEVFHQLIIKAMEDLMAKENLPKTKQRPLLP